MRGESRVMEYKIKSIIAHLESTLAFVYRLRESARLSFLNYEKHFTTVWPGLGARGTVCMYGC